MGQLLKCTPVFIGKGFHALRYITRESMRSLPCTLLVKNGLLGGLLPLLLGTGTCWANTGFSGLLCKTFKSLIG